MATIVSPVEWNLESQRTPAHLAAHGLIIRAGKMSGLWSTNSATSIKLSDLDVICTVLGSEVAREPLRARNRR
ncbi:helix-turn-helix domain-containing protein [Nocardia aobensis]|uniref:helix-turn-helix domain-containing protein n=1 Tax=Nocardia aobensis TaxID=257277 RepID=UPI001FE1B127|nr:helix-turn-helix domain-containing protein [Nocardia aobensis]